MVASTSCMAAINSSPRAFLISRALDSKEF
jgi:hypothetical protein